MSTSIQALVASLAAAPTSDWNYTRRSLGLHCNGTNGSTTFTDNSPSAKTITANGGAVVSTTQSKFGGASLALNGTNAYLSAPHSSDFSIHNVDFTLAAWVYRSASGVLHYLMSKRPSSGNEGWEWRINATDLLQFFYTGGSGLMSTATVPSGVWTHLATCRVNGTVMHFIDGVMAGSAGFADGTDNTSATFKLGTDNTASSFFSGYQDDIQIYKGVGLYAADFTPPAAAFFNS